MNPLDELERLANAATPGPWNVADGSADVYAGSRRVAANPWIGKDAKADANMVLIAAAVNALPALVAVARTAEKERNIYLAHFKADPSACGPNGGLLTDLRLTQLRLGAALAKLKEVR